MTTLTEHDDGRTVTLRVGERLLIDLPENATTGYRWAVDRCDAAVIQPIGSEAHYPEGANGGTGASGRKAFTVQGKQVGAGDILLKHWRHWEGDASIIGRFRLRLNVVP